MKIFTIGCTQTTAKYMPSFAPTPDILQDHRCPDGHWELYAQRFMRLLRARNIENVERALLRGACLLCSEAEPLYCHRCLVAEYLQAEWRNVEIVHL